MKEKKHHEINHIQVVNKKNQHILLIPTLESIFKDFDIIKDQTCCWFNYFFKSHRTMAYSCLMLPNKTTPRMSMHQ